MLYSTRPTIVKLTKAQYDALDPADKTNDTIYFITDVNGMGDKFQPVIYSEEEREIGVWKDGKPLYEKTIALDTTLNFTIAVIADLTDYNIDILVGYLHTTFSVDELPGSSTRLIISDRLIYLAYKLSDKKLYAAENYSERKITGKLITTLRYTKTTDTAGSGTWTPQGVPAIHYSTDERVVGTWIDGSIVYEKTFDLGNETSIPYNSWYNTGLSGFNKICGCFGMNNSGAYYPLNASIQSDTLHLWSCRGIEVSVVRYLTIQYTKSST